MNDTGSGFTIRLGRTSRKQFSYQDVERMNMKDYIFPYGSGTVTLSLEETRVLGVLKGHDTPPLDDIGKGLYESLDAPVQSCSLRKWTSSGDKVALIISDMSRFWMRQDLVIPHLIHYLNEECGIPDEDITILVANGTHVGGDEKELRTLVTSEIYDRIRVINHDCLAEDLVTIGVTSRGTTVRINKIAAMADRVIALGACTHHVMAGYGGGRKSILPGISAMDTICHNHAFALDPEVFRSNPLIGNSVTKGNPLNEDMCEAAALVPMLFTINLVMNADMKLCKIFSGDCQASWEAGCRAIDDIYRVNVKEKADVVIASCGGYPKDMSLYQGTKTIDNIEPGLKTGGTLILMIEARDGGGPAEYFDWLRPLEDGTFEEKLRNHFTVPGYIFLLNCEQAQRYRIMMLTTVPEETLAVMGIEGYSDIRELMKQADLTDKTIYVIPNGATVIPCVEAD